ncbi:MAG: hypothetical protein EOO28_36885, partial [Comamonadaceae bacterium]
MSAVLATGNVKVNVLLPGVGSGVVLVPVALFVTEPPTAVTSAVTVIDSVLPEASVAIVATAVPVPIVVTEPFDAGVLPFRL